MNLRRRTRHIFLLFPELSCDSSRSSTARPFEHSLLYAAQHPKRSRATPNRDHGIFFFSTGWPARLDRSEPAIGFGNPVRTGDDQEAINRLFSPEFRNRLDSIISFAGDQLASLSSAPSSCSTTRDLPERGSAILMTEGIPSR